MSHDAKGFMAAFAALAFFMGWVIDLGYLINSAPDWALPFVVFGGVAIAFPVFYGAFRVFHWLLDRFI